ncbi:uncharacterized protein EURHEDRAFT_351895 [Aspergillus ruber CBS 135680]|uniref:Uncharacterized protein n=1 Tax=Aspergillus ruber (strain CBS 135680) TaxID=1388766 RepID=A0A017SHI2_ASPRC|nr:uncharacterized protein EURHEDRAFT_351895 [Aspergillus ruber CBS 135680]EYE96418.1 hypothetical protein EURHEDRAFT_351895 [Aspergillus ruber CBS 135680]
MRTKSSGYNMTRWQAGAWYRRRQSNLQCLAVTLALCQLGLPLIDGNPFSTPISRLELRMVYRRWLDRSRPGRGCTSLK